MGHFIDAECPIGVLLPHNDFPAFSDGYTFVVIAYLLSHDVI